MMLVSREFRALGAAAAVELARYACYTCSTNRTITAFQSIYLTSDQRRSSPLSRVGRRAPLNLNFRQQERNRDWRDI